MRYRVIQIALSAGILTLVVVMFVSIYQTQLSNRQVGRENQTFARFTACVLSIPPFNRTQDRIDQCWTAVQQDTGVTVKRYDKE